MKSSIKIVISICLLLANITAQAALPQGLWKVQQVTIEKDTDGKIENTVYKSAADVKSYIPCLQELEINTQNIVIRYPGGWEETTDHVLKDNQLMILIADVINYGEYNTQDESLMLTAHYRYVKNLPTHTERVIEKWIITLKR